MGEREQESKRERVERERHTHMQILEIAADFHQNLHTLPNAAHFSLVRESHASCASNL
jgi:hypothetical protein